MSYKVVDKILFLSEVSKVLSSTLDYYVSLAVLAKIVVENIGDLCLIDVSEKDKIRRVTVKFSDKSKKKLAESFFDYPPDPRNKYAIYYAAKSREFIVVKKITKSWLKKSSKIPQERELVEKLGIKSIVFAPLISRTRVIGVLTVGSAKNNFSYSDDDGLFIQELANRAGIAVDKAMLYKQAQEAVRARDEFLSIASHELKTPLTTILLNLQMALVKARRESLNSYDTKQIVRMLDISVQQAKRISSLIDDLLNTSLMSSGKLKIQKENADLVELVGGVVDRFSGQLKEKKIKISLSLPRKLSGRWDSIRIEQVITNLLSNAIKYGNNKPIKLEISRDKNSVRIKVIDHGIGIPENKKNLIFESFKRAVENKNYEGIGVGLYISKQIIEAHGGEIFVESKEGKGSVFTVELPTK